MHYVMCYQEVCLCFFLLHGFREDSGMFGKRPGYQVTLRKLAELQQKIEGWEVYEYDIVCMWRVLYCF